MCSNFEKTASSSFPNPGCGRRDNGSEHSPAQISPRPRVISDSSSARPSSRSSSPRATAARSRSSSPRATAASDAAVPTISSSSDSSTESQSDASNYSQLLPPAPPPGDQYRASPKCSCLQDECTRAGFRARAALCIVRSCRLHHWQKKYRNRRPRCRSR